MTRAHIRVAVVLALLGGVFAVPANAAAGPFPDVPDTFWAKTAIQYVAVDHEWMADFGDNFQPEAVETKRRFASALMQAFDPTGEVDPDITFPDLAVDNPFYRAANISVQHGWMTVNPSGQFKPFNGVTTTMVHRALVLALGLQEEVDGIAALHLDDGLLGGPGTPVALDRTRVPYLILGMQLNLRYNHGTETEDVMPGTVLHRDEVAYSLWRAAITSSWTLDGLQTYRTISLPAMDETHRQVVEFGLKYVGYPYIWAGEWYAKTGSGYCCGAQPKGGFDCSGWTWWLVKKPAGGYDNTAIRGYTGWALPERSSAAMAGVGAHLTYAKTLPGDIMFYDSTSSTAVSHVNVYAGNGWALDSSSGHGGVSLIKVDSGYYFDHFLWSRRLTA